MRRLLTKWGVCSCLLVVVTAFIMVPITPATAQSSVEIVVHITEELSPDSPLEVKSAHSHPLFLGSSRREPSPRVSLFAAMLCVLVGGATFISKMRRRTECLSALIKRVRDAEELLLQSEPDVLTSTIHPFEAKPPAGFALGKRLKE